MKVDIFTFLMLVLISSEATEEDMRNLTSFSALHVFTSFVKALVGFDFLAPKIAKPWILPWITLFNKTKKCNE